MVLRLPTKVYVSAEGRYCSYDKWPLSVNMCVHGADLSVTDLFLPSDYQYCPASDVPFVDRLNFCLFADSEFCLCFGFVWPDR